jgi:hypothetical protein
MSSEREGREDLEARVQRLEKTLDELTRQVQTLRDIREIEQLKIRFMAAADVRSGTEPGAYDSQAIANLFTEDGILDEGPEIGVVLHGRTEIKEFYDKARTEWIKFGVHYLLNPVVDVTGDSAQASWYFFEPLTYAPTGEAYWCAAKWEDELVRVNGRWLIKKAIFLPWFMSPFEKGWAKQRFPWEGSERPQP